MTPERLNRIILSGMDLLPAQMNSQMARRMLVAIAVQESGLRYRRQLLGGPARGWWQFEQIAVEDALTRPSIATYTKNMVDELALPRDSAELHTVIEWNDMAAAVLARLVLWTVPQPLPGPHDVAEGWRQYLSAWKPGHPRSQKWTSSWETAMTIT